ncbi:hypothetical protein TPL01_06480 [Sulfuriferula plumbiphila]|uniref:NADH-quinone oxidoreductase subunit L n=1 Tax=Sulfuriferula plumbiphila TaxID=171865 RepID=A0A512L4Y4_9PROT|nr:proton-conducting transporter membrane subunit [Sulfuriferula plumbiphila]BBP03223.1 hypothetical protein SFPGR_06450 [Sulfuriferula plumbiphila]GEP29510.1 hypothetical protein TPL01_06480 [Sulfuriferula plumbiphila]
MSFLALVVLAPLAAAALIPLVRRAPAAFALAGAGIGLVASLWLLADAFDGVHHTLILPGLPDMPLRLISEPLNALLSVMVAVVGAFVLVYAVGYMKEDPDKPRFFATLSFFIAAMQTLVLAGDWVLLLAAWELIGLSSYLLIGFWYQRPGVWAAATRAFLYTRTADLGLYTAVFILIAATGSSEIAAALHTGGAAAFAAGLLLLVAAMGKSAQTPLHDWLLGAMAGPTPVSALLHSATLVAAGAILLIRTSPLLPSDALLAVGLVGGVTTVVTGLIALGEKDLKRLLAASTSSQYGLMLVAVGAGVPLAALLHLIAHAAIKSSLFLGAGVFQHSRESTRLTDLHGAGHDRPRIFAGFALAALALAGIPPLSGFFSKDAVIAAALSSEHAALLGSLALAGTLLTGAYMARALRILWRGERQKRPVAGLAWMGAGLAGLASLAVILGRAFPSIEGVLVSHLPESTVAQIAGLGAALTGLVLGWFAGGQRLLGPLLTWAQQGFAIAGGMDAWVVRPALALAQACEQLESRLYRAILAMGRLGLAIGRVVRKSDERGVDGLIFALVRGSLALGAQVRTLQSGLIHRELAMSVVGAALILAALMASLLALT